MKTHKMTI